ncbi:MAG: hypothetical protein IJ728_11505 [Selenomonadaceae bacterium]|nr:hypothetical protein [Selenomonadaceae bacterium]
MYSINSENKPKLKYSGIVKKAETYNADPFNIYDYHFIVRLMLIEAGHISLQNVFSTNRKNGSNVDTDSETQNEISSDEIPIPEELDGLPEDLARSVLKNADSSDEDDSSQEFENNSDDQSEQVDQQNDTENIDDAKVPYSKLREQAEKARIAEEQLAAYKKRFGELNQSQPFEQPQQPQQQIQTPKPQPLSEEAVEKIKSAIHTGALQLSGLSQDEVDGIDYMDDDDPRRGRWHYAQKLAENTVMQNIVAAQIADQQREQQKATLNENAINEFNDFVAKQKTAKNFPEIAKFAINDFFNSQSEVEKQIIFEANWRLDNQVATPADLVLIRDYFTRAKAVFDRQQKKSQPKPKTKPLFPRSNQVGGSSGNGGGFSNSSLEHMLRNNNWNKIPPEYKKKLLGL